MAGVDGERRVIMYLRLIPLLALIGCHSTVLAPSVPKRTPSYPRPAAAPAPPSSTLTLDTALARARTADPAARRQAAEIAQAKTALLRSHERNEPELRVGLSTDSLSTGIRFRPMPRAVLEARVGTAAATVAAAEAAAAAESWDLEMPIREKFVQIHFLTEAIAIVNQLIARKRELRNHVETTIDRNQTTFPSLIPSIADVLREVTRRDQRVNELAKIRRELAALLQLHDPAPAFDVDPAHFLALEADSLDSESLIARTLARHPLVEAARQRAALAQSAVGEALAAESRQWFTFVQGAYERDFQDHEYDVQLQAGIGLPIGRPPNYELANAEATQRVAESAIAEIEAAIANTIRDRVRQLLLSDEAVGRYQAESSGLVAEMKAVVARIGDRADIFRPRIIDAEIAILESQRRLNELRLQRQLAIEALYRATAGLVGQ